MPISYASVHLGAIPPSLHVPGPTPPFERVLHLILTLPGALAPLADAAIAGGASSDPDAAMAVTAAAAPAAAADDDDDDDDARAGFVCETR